MLDLGEDRHSVPLVSRVDAKQTKRREPLVTGHDGQQVQTFCTIQRIHSILKKWHTWFSEKGNTHRSLKNCFYQWVLRPHDQNSSYIVRGLGTYRTVFPLSSCLFVSG